MRPPRKSGPTLIKICAIHLHLSVFVNSSKDVKQSGQKVNHDEQNP